MLFPVVGLLDETFTPAVCPRHFEPLERASAVTRDEGLDAECSGPEVVDDVS